MSLPHVLVVECRTCRVAKYCPQNGSSPLRLPSGQAIACRLIGGYGKKPIDRSVLSEDNEKLFDIHGPCLTIAEIPYVDEGSGLTVYGVVKIFSPPIVHERESMNESQMKAAMVKNQR